MPDSPQERYERIQEILQEAILRDYPNPERRGCVGDDVLKRMAERTRPVRDAQWEHVTHCSPCYREFLDFRAQVLERQARGRRTRRRALAAAAVLIVVGIYGYFLLTNRGGSSVAKRVPTPVAQKNLVSAVLIWKASLKCAGPKSNLPANCSGFRASRWRFPSTCRLEANLARTKSGS